MSEAMSSKAERFAQVKNQLEFNAHRYLELDPANATLGYFAKAALAALNRSQKGGLHEVVDYLLEMRDDIDGPHAVKSLERGYQADLMQHDVFYPYAYRNEQSWRRTFEEIDVDNDIMRWGVLANNVTLRPIQSNVAERYKSIKLISALIKDRFDGPISVLDIGSSVLHGGLKLLHEGNSDSPIRPFEAMEVLRSKETNDHDHRLTELANLALRETLTFGPIMGIDMTDIDDPSVRRWAMSCSFYPDELRDPTNIADYIELDTIDPTHEQVHFFQDNFAELDRKNFAKVSPVEQWDIITFSTVFYQATKHERFAMLVNASSLLSDDGLIIIQDARDGNFSTPFNYTTSIIDAQAHTTSREQPLLTWEDGRCKRAATSDGSMIVNGRSSTINEALEAQYGAAI